VKKPPLARALRTLGLSAAILALFLAFASLPWRGAREAAAPRVVARAACEGPLRAGAGEAPFEIPEGSPIAGFPRLDWRSEGPPGPVGARALVLEAGSCRVALASAEILVVPGALAGSVRARVADLGLDGLVVGATHTHASPGGYWDDRLAEVVGLGPYDAAMAERIAGGVARAIRAAAGAVGPARSGWGALDASGLVRNRDGGGVEGRLALLRLARPDGAPVAEVAVLGSHATVLGKRNRRIDGDWPGLFLRSGGRGLRLFLQGALGDQKAALPGAPRVEAAAYARAVSEAAAAEVPWAAEEAAALGFARVEVTLPALGPGAVPSVLRPAVRNLFGGAVPATTTVSALRLGPALLVFVPAEPVASVAAAWRTRPGLGGAAIVSLADDYLGYAEAPDRWEAGEGEAVRTYLGPELADRLGEGAAAAAAASR
jgi:hypothetical protein